MKKAGTSSHSILNPAMLNVFIRTNGKQMLGALLGRHAILRTAAHPERVEVRYINVDEIDLFKAFEGRQYSRKGHTLTYTLDDLQSFTLAAFMAPQLMGYQGRAMVIDPDVFAITDVERLFERDLRGKSLAARPKRGAWDTSVMMLDCAKLKHWDMKTILDDLAAFRTTYEDWMTVRHEDVDDLEPEWNSWDALTPSTNALHTTNRLTQPWKTGLKIDFTRNPVPKLFGVVPREWLMWLRGDLPSRYQPHPDKGIETFFFRLVKDALAHGAVTKEMVEAEIKSGHVRPDLLERAAKA